ncbi:hypothetical protein J2S16_000420 [Cytobacillus kochii]|nr:hypothetical protein [Cytobacillus kochii]MDQ0183860.1 hypothetical protein [Cytobacillus kochii]MEA1852950.1 hypothetical protein [Cytobacillus sp. OWB-43]
MYIKRGATEESMDKKSNIMLFVFILGIAFIWGLIYWLFIAPQS